MSKPFKTRTISKKDDIKQTEAWEMISNLRKDDHSGLLVPKEHVEYRKEHCGYCGKSMKGQEKGLWFGELFHTHCCEEMGGKRAAQK